MLLNIHTYIYINICNEILADKLYIEHYPKELMFCMKIYQYGYCVRNILSF